MEKALGQIIEILDQTQELYQQLLAIVQQEQSAVLNSKIDQLSALLVEKQSLLSQLAGIENRRNHQLKQLAVHLGMPIQQLTLTRLASKSPAHFAEQINGRRIALRQLVRAIGKANDENRSMISHCLNLVHGSLQFLQHWITPPPVYGASGHIDGRTKNGHLLSGTI